eukprot:TRINITY_DN3779_c0_g1_i2.p3 TRINITY_DN3779_c0_g1~~TRINITY_DN3779_c0_g1_i2.p3  ORF type:complete len:221 (-),score=42.89 TRINITY_DN3779_c0_g1_i2:224-886(-)
MSQRILYWGSGSAPCWRALLALEEKGLEYESKLMEFSKQDHKSAEVVALNPRGQFPTFKDGDAIVNESLAIVEYLERMYPTPPLIPADKKACATALQRFHEVTTSTETFREAFLMKMRDQIKTEEDQKKFDNALEVLKGEIKMWDGYLATSGGFAAGSEFTIADINLVPFLLSAQRFGATFKEYPNVLKYVDALKTRPTVQKTMPPHWKDSEPKDWLAMI